MINESARSAFDVQRYDPAPGIDGVELLPLRRFNDDGGSMTELGRLSAGHLENGGSFEVQQINYSEMEPGVVKAFHLHMHQTDVWYIPPSCKMLVVLGDVRSGSPSEGVVRRMVLGDGNSRLLKIPPGVAHGLSNIGTVRAHLIYFVNRHFNPAPDDCDEGRLPWDHFGADVWEIVKG